jgi:hypothetical protein
LHDLVALNGDSLIDGPHLGRAGLIVHADDLPVDKDGVRIAEFGHLGRQLSQGVARLEDEQQAHGQDKGCEWFDSHKASLN